MRRVITSKCLLALLGLFLSFSAANAALVGTYTINAGASASSTNYQSLTAAIGDLSTGVRSDGGPVNGPGVSGPVVLRLAAGSGPYNEQLTIPAITGASAANTIRISGGPSRQTVQFTGTTTNDRQVFKLNGCKHVTLDSLTIINNDAVYGYGVHITNNADSNVVQNSLITVLATSTSANFCGISISGLSPTTTGNNGDFNTVQNNIVSGGYYGYSCNGTSTTVFSEGNHVLNNEFRDFYYYGIRHYEQTGARIIGNKVHARATGTTAGYGMYIYYNDRFTIERNWVYDFGAYGFYMYYANYQGGTGTSRASLRNNFVGGTALGTTPYGIYASTNVTNVDIFHNSVSLTSGDGRAIYLIGGSGNDIRNNIFSITNSSTGYAMYSSLSTYVSAVNKNDFWAPGSSNFVFIGSAFTPGTFVGGGGFNTGSLNVDPSFVDPLNDLHINSNPNLYDAGDNLGVTTDYDGQTRPLAPSTGYDIGADEFNVSLNDAGAFAVTSPVQPFGPGVQNVNFTIKNFGLATLTTATLNWQVNGVTQTPFAFTGSLPTASISAPFTAGTYNFLPGSSNSIKAWTSNPNGGGDANNFNDTILVNVCTSLSGTYSIGGVGADYPTINAAVDALVCGGVSGPVTFNLTQGAGPFNEQVIIPSIPGASGVNTIRFNGGANRETVQFTGTTTNERAVIKLNGADHIILDSLTITNNDLSFANGIHLINSADSNTIKNCIVNVDPLTTSANFAGIAITGSSATTAGDNGDDNLILNNVVNGGYYGIVMQGLSTTVYDQRNSIIGNTINNTYYYPIRCYSQLQTKVEKNIINFRSTGSTTGYMIYMYYADDFDVSKNIIQRGGAYGIYSYYGNYQGGGPGGRARISNNMIGGTWTSTSPYGIYLSTNSTNIDIFHNSVSFTSGNGRCLYIVSGSGNDVRNNSFGYFNSATGYAAYVSLATYVSGMDYNNYYTENSSNFLFVGSAFSPSTYVGGGGFNINSIDGDPNYIDPVNDLHAFATQLFDNGDPSVGLTSDIDDQLRPNPQSMLPDIGADEYLPDSVNIAVVALLEPISFICPDSNQVVKLVINNKGLNSISNIALTANISGLVTTTMTATFAGPIALGGVDTVTMGTINTWPGGTLNITAYCAVPNDQDLANDTLTVTRSINLVPAQPTSAAVSICTGDSAQLIATATGTQYWYDAPFGGNLLATNDTLNTGGLSSTTNYYVESRGVAPNSVTTTFANNNSCGGGNMFDIYAINSITIDSFDVNLSAGATVDVYYKVGSHLGFETNSGAWTLLGSANVVGAGVGQPSRCVVGGLTIPSGQTYGIFLATGTMVYTTLASATTYSTPDLDLTAGTGLCGLFSGTNFPRGWNGTLYYTATGCPSPRTMVPVTVLSPPSVNLADTTACGGLTLDAGNPGGSYVWSTGDVSQTISVTNTGMYGVTVSNGVCDASDSVLVFIESQPSVALGPDSLLCNGAGMTLNAGSNPGASFLWSTGDTSQTITVNAAGTYTVTVSTPAGCSANDDVIVTALNSPSGAISVDTTNCPNLVFTGTNTGGTASTTSWNFGDGNVATGTNPTNIYASNGSYVVTFTQDNGCGSNVATTTITVDCIVGTIEPNAANVALYPNPTRGNAELKLELPVATEGLVELTDIHGKMVLQFRASMVAGTNQINLDLNQLSAGVYLVHVSAEGLNWQGKLVKE